MPKRPRSSSRLAIQPVRQLVVAGGQVEERIQGPAHVVVEARDDDLVEVVLDRIGADRTLGAHEGVDEQHRLHHLDVEDAEGPQADQPQLRVLVGHGVARAPLEVGEDLQVDEVHLRPQGAFHAPGERGDLREDGDVGRLQGVSAGAENPHGLALIEEDRRLALAHRELGAPLDLPRTLLGQTVNDLLARLVEPFQVFQEKDIPVGHAILLQWGVKWIFESIGFTGGGLEGRGHVLDLRMFSSIVSAWKRSSTGR